MSESTPSPRQIDAEGFVNSVTKGFRKLLRELPQHIRKLARERYKLFLRNPHHPSFENKLLYDNRKSSHVSGSHSIRVNMTYRAIFVFRDGKRVCYWIGGHRDYDA